MPWFLERVGKRLKAIKPNGETVEVIIRNTYNAGWFYQASLLGWKFMDEFDFDLPAVESAPMKPRVHNAGESTCISCEG